LTWKIMQGDVKDKLAEIPDGTVQCVVTSPPYFGLRSYLPDTHKDKQLEIGLESTPELYVQNMVEVFREVHRVLRDDGTLWLNLGDSYAGSGKAGNNPEYQRRHTQFGQKERKERLGVPVPARAIGYKPKDLIPIPWLVAIALQKDGWWLRSGIPWLKNSAMPESVTDRPSSALEYFFLLSKSKKYFYDAEAIRIPGAVPAGTRAAKGSAERASQHGVNARPPDYKIYSGTRNRRNTDWFMESIKDILDGKNGTLLHDENGLPVAIFCNPQPYKEAHFATFSPRLITPMILAGTSPAPVRYAAHRGRGWLRKKGLTVKLVKKSLVVGGMAVTLQINIREVSIVFAQKLTQKPSAGSLHAPAKTPAKAAASSLTRLPAVAQPFGWLNIMAGIR
jgi:DNA modification methylase